MDATIESALREMGLEPADITALFLVPAALVAWADGDADMKELEAIAESHRCDCDEADCLCMTETARQFLYRNFAYQRPQSGVLRAALGCLNAHLFALPRDRADRLRMMIFAVAMDVAKSSHRGMLGRLRAVSEAERLAIANMAGALGFHDIPLLQTLIEAHE